MRNHTKTLIALSMLLVPLHALSTGVLTVADSVAGVGIEASARGFEPNGTADLVLVPPSLHYLVFPLALDNQGNASAHVPATSVTEAGSYTAFVGKDGKRLSQDVAFEVMPSGVDPLHSTVSVDRDTLTPDGQDVARVTVTLVDGSGNPLPHRLVQLVGANAGVAVQALQSDTDGAGTIEFAVTTTQPGTITLRALDALSDTLLGRSATIIAKGNAAVAPSPFRAQLAQVSPTGTPSRTGIVASFRITLDPASFKAGEPGSMRIEAVDSDGNIVQNYTGTVSITSPTDPQAILPGFSDSDNAGKAQFKSKDLGVRSMPFSLTFRKTGKQTVRVEDDTDPARVIAGEASVAVTKSTSAGINGLTIISPKQNSTVNATTIIVQGITQPLTNIKINGGKDKVNGESDEDGNFAISVPLDTNQSEYTLFVSDDTGNDATVRFVRDTDPPVITDAAFNPPTPEEKQSTLLVVKSEPGLPSAEMKLGEERIVLREDPSKPGTYQALFAPNQVGSFKPTLTMTDAAGNASTLQLTLNISAKKPPKITRLTVTPRNGSADLVWTPVTDEPIDRYRVYVGESPTDFGYTLDTPDASQSAASVTGLKSGTTYYFAVTSVKDEAESDKSEVASAQILGLTLEVEPTSDGLNIQWSLPSAITVHSFILEYGVEPNAFTEKRRLPGGDLKANEKRSLALHDLMPSVTYYVRLTPVDTTGDLMTDLMANGYGTPSSEAGTHFAAPEQLPRFGTPRPTTGNPQTGVPAIAWELLLAAAIPSALFLVVWRRNRRARQFLRMMERRYHS